MHKLYPDIKPYASHRFAVGSEHVLHVEECGVRDGIPVIFLHGGPGAGTEPMHRRFFDPERYRIVIFDQRGAGQSIPHASLEENTTWDLVADIETIREQLDIDKMAVFGGSWGSTLGLAYAETHPDRVLALILRGIFLCRPQDIQWFYQEGASRLSPEEWEHYLVPIPESERADLVSAYHRRLTGANEIERLRAARAWSHWEASNIALERNNSVISHFAEAHTALSVARIECHYFMNNSFLEPDQLLRDAHKIADIPGVIVHGRYDLICPLDNAWELSKAWPKADLTVVTAGHAVSEPAITHTLIAATNRFADEFA